MKERPILFSAPMVRAILAGTKTQTRRVVKPQPRRVDGGVPFGDGPAWAHAEPGSAMIRCPYGQRGDRLWVRETWAPEQYDADATTIAQIEASVRMPAYAADFSGQPAYKWRPSIHMPRWASRITLEVTGVRVERLQDISEADAIAEGIVRAPYGWWSGREGSSSPTAIGAYALLWEQINGPGSWDANPWVWVVEFRRLP